MALNRKAGMDYAKKYWNRVCDDGLIGASPHNVAIEQKRTKLHAPAPRWEAIFVDYPYAGSRAEKAVFHDTHGLEGDKDIQPWAGLLDCAHFLSRCLTAEGIKVSTYGVPDLVTMLMNRKGDTKTLAEKVPRAQGQRVVNSGILKPGDMIGYVNVNAEGYHKDQYGHSGMYVGKDHDPLGGMTSHTYCRFSGKTFPDGYTFGDSWYLHDPDPHGDSFVYTFIHFSADDQPLTGAMAHSLRGWWKVEAGTTTVYYHVALSGTARSSATAPKSELEPAKQDGDSAYYFRDGSKIIFIWRKTGDVAVWLQGGDNTQFNVTLNGTAGRATRVTFSSRGGRH